MRALPCTTSSTASCGAEQGGDRFAVSAFGMPLYTPSNGPIAGWASAPSGTARTSAVSSAGPCDPAQRAPTAKDNGNVITASRSPDPPSRRWGSAYGGAHGPQVVAGGSRAAPSPGRPYELEPSITSPKRTQVLPSHFCSC